ncbi:MAG: hypothetical protein NTX61_01530 [Bacteroidetes bacterium]|nr:hypothetical protein [Bacteroidota bacterium]
MIELKSIDDISVISDWAELNVIFYNTPLSKSKLISVLEDNGYEEDVNYGGDELYDSIIQELEKRKSLYGNSPPYSIVNSVITPLIKWIDYPEYILCLIFSYWGAADAQNGTSLFEQVSNIALKNYLSGEAITIGFPNAGNLSGQLDKLAGLLNEDRAAKNPPPKAKDDGVDVIGWNSFGDNRRGQLIVLMQCAAGKNWNLKKQIRLSVWSQYINWFFETTIPSMSITEILPTNKWANAVESYGIVFDRARIYRCLYKPNTSIDPSLRVGVVQWCDTKLN